MHLLSGVPIALAGIAGSLMVLPVNAWMQNPSGFRLEGGRAVDVEPVAALFGNSYLWPQLVHMYLAAYIVVGFLIAGAYAWSWLRGRRSRCVSVALSVALTAAALAASAQIVVGDWIARQVAEDQPTKLAAFEGLGETERGAAIHIGGWYDEDTGEVEYGIPIPRLLSLLAYQRDEDLRGPRFFDVSKHRRLRFQGEADGRTGESSWAVAGELAIRDVTRQISFDVELRGTNVDQRGRTKLGASATAALERVDFDLTTELEMESGDEVGPDVSVRLDIEAILERE